MSAKTLAGVLFLAVALMGAVALCPQRVRGQGRTVADFEWLMPDRFGHFPGGQRLLNYPQSEAEVDSGPFAVDFRLRDAACASGVGREWTVAGRTAEAERLGGGCAFRLVFEREGAYDVELHVTGRGRDDTSKQRVVVQDLLVVSIGDSVASGEGNPDNQNAARPTWQNKRCHRSSFAGTARAAGRLEAADPKSSVTFVHLACSGATVHKGLTGGYKGAQAGRFPRPRLLPAQLDELQGIARKRQVDAVLISVGANDVGFANIVAFCITHSRCQDKGIKPKKLGLPGGPKRRLNEAVTASLGQLPSSFDEVNERLPEGLARNRVFLVEYFDSTHATRDDFCGRILGGVGRDELRWAFENVLAPLNVDLRRASSGHRWRYVGGVADLFAGHGYCAGPQRWVRRFKESLTQQGFNWKGALHPNEEGHAQTGELIDAALRPVLLPHGRADEPAPPQEQDEAVADQGVVPAAAAAGNGSGGGDLPDWLLPAGGGVAGALLLAGLGVAGWRRRRPEKVGGDEKKEREDEGAQALGEAGRRWLNAGRLGAFAGLLAVVAAVLLGDLSSAEATTALIGLVGLALILALTPANAERLLTGLRKVSVGPVELEWMQDAEMAAVQAGGDEDDAGEGERLIELRRRLEFKLTWVAKHMGTVDRWPLGFLTVGSLDYDGYLTAEQGRTAARIMTASEGALAGWPADRRSKFLGDAAKLVGNVRASVFFGLVKETLKDKNLDWGALEVAEVIWEEGRRADLLVTRDGKSVRVATVFPYWKDSKVPIGNAQDRLGKLDGAVPVVAVIPRFIRQYPGHEGGRLDRPHDQVPVVYLDELPARLADLT